MARRGALDLAHYEQARVYEKTFRSRTHDIAYFLKIAAQSPGQSVLEYGAGAGRITLPLLEQGHPVTALDASRSMLDLLRKRALDLSDDERSRLRIVLGDMRKKELRERYVLVLATFNVVGHLATFQDMAAFLRCAKNHLKKGGKLVFDVPLPHPEELEADPDELFPAPRFKHPETREWIRQSERFEYDPNEQTLLVESRFRTEDSQDELIVPLTLRQWFPKEVEALLIYEGYRRIETHADYTMQPGALSRDTIIFVATP